MDPKVSSTEEATVAEQVDGQDANENAVPSTAEKADAKQPESMLDAITAAVDRKSEKESSSDSEEAGKDAKPDPNEEAQEAEAGKELSEEEKDKKLPFHKHPRWQEMKRQRDDATRERDNYREAYEWKQRFDGYMAQATLTPAEFNTGLQIMEAMKKDPRSALKALLPYVESLQLATGEILPADLKQEVDGGYITAERAQELANARNRVSMADQQSREAKERADNAIVNNLSAEASRWELKWQESDPDYERKKNRVGEKIEFALIRAQQAGNIPTTREGVVKLCDAAKKEVEDEIASWLPKPTPKIADVVPGSNSVKSSPQPKTMLEAMQLALHQ